MSYNPYVWIGLAGDIVKDDPRAIAWREGYAASVRDASLRIAEEEKSNCLSCQEGIPVPHYASPRCESGKHNHCSCETCF